MDVTEVFYEPSRQTRK